MNFRFLNIIFEIINGVLILIDAGPAAPDLMDFMRIAEKTLPQLQPGLELLSPAKRVEVGGLTGATVTFRALAAGGLGSAAWDVQHSFFDVNGQSLMVIASYPDQSPSKRLLDNMQLSLEAR